MNEKRICGDCGESFECPIQAPFKHCPSCFEDDGERGFEGEVDDRTKLKRAAKRRARYSRRYP